MPVLVKKSKGSVVYIKDEQSKDIYLVKKGAVALQDSDLPSILNDTVYKEGDIVEFFSSIINIPRQSTAICEEESELIIFTLEEFKQNVIAHPQVGIKMLLNFVQILNKLTQEELVINNNKPGSRDEAIEHSEKNIYNTAVLLGNEGKKIQALKIFIRFVENYRLHPLSQQAQNNIRLLTNQLQGNPALISIMQGEDNDPETRKVYHKGDIVFVEGEVGNKFYVIREGSVRIFKIGAKGFSTIEILNTGSVFGELAILSKAPRAATIMAESPTLILLELTKDNFKEVLFEYPKILLGIVKNFAMRIWQTSIRIKISKISSPQAKILQMLIYLCVENKMTSIRHEEDQLQSFFNTKETITIQNPLKMIMDWCMLPPTEVSHQLEILKNSKSIEYNKATNEIIIADLFDLSNRLKRKIGNVNR